MSKIKTFGEVDQRSLQQLERCMASGDAEFGVLCADHHPGYSQPIGGGVAYEGYVSVSGVGWDIGCGNKAALTCLTRADLDQLGGVERVMKEIARRISFGIGVPARDRVDHPVLDKIRNAEFAPQRALTGLAEKQLGTVGSGNHYVNLMEDEDGRIWVGVHFGSRGFGHKTAGGFLALAQGLPFGSRIRESGMDSPPALFEADSELGRSYISAMQLAGAYAYAGRDVVVAKVLEILGVGAVHEVHNHHNFCVAGSERVQTPAGAKRMDEVQVGEEVFAFDVSTGLVPTRVVDAWHSGRKPIYEVRTDNRRIRCSGDHPLLTIAIDVGPHPERPWHSRSSGHLVWKPAAEIRRGDIVVIATAPCANGTSIGAGQARLVGAFLGDGWFRTDTARRGYTLGLAIGAADEPHTARYLALCEAELPGRWQNNARGHYGLSCSSKDAYEAALALGVGVKSSARRLPTYAFTLPASEKLELLAGYFDSDGSVAGPSTSNHGRGAIAATSGELVEGLRELACRLGFCVTCVRHERMRTNYGDPNVYRCVVSASSMAALDLWHEAKAARIRAVRRGQGLSSKKIGYLELPPGIHAQRVTIVTLRAAEEVYDLRVEHPSHSFVCEGVVVHNCWRETHFGRDYWVIRKGCTPARPGQEGFVGGSMGDESVILEGIESPENEQALYSTVHGAGRVMSRSQAAGRVRRRKAWVCTMRDCPYVAEQAGACPEHAKQLRKVWVAEQVKPGLVDWPAVQERLRRQGIVLVGGGADEAPEVYKRLPEVLAAHAGTVRVKHTLRPLGVAMAGRDVHDPYKD
jgi:RNA-splicing ligase RtcB